MCIRDRYKTMGRIGKDKEFEDTNARLTFDKVNADDAGYCQKCKKSKGWCRHRAENPNPKEVYAVPTTSSQQIGWRVNYDTIDFGHKRNGLCKKTFYNTGHI
eukprot:TRINITY_DN1695_c0_g2_i5.p1 TRINITY_DN1695_c0_g2~~TRINITY_DN1695_c0_g2_i5.p1  ORF type:complete len:102 (-),score=35.80 TRINITY_DN1695_c0_g2_i5:71-376(-)